MGPTLLGLMKKYSAQWRRWTTASWKERLCREGVSVFFIPQVHLRSVGEACPSYQDRPEGYSWKWPNEWGGPVHGVYRSWTECKLQATDTKPLKPWWKWSVITKSFPECAPSLNILPDLVYERDKFSWKRWWQVQLLANHYWKPLLKDYIPSLQERLKWQHEHRTQEPWNWRCCADCRWQGDQESLGSGLSWEHVYRSKRPWGGVQKYGQRGLHSSNQWPSCACWKERTTKRVVESILNMLAS